MARDRSPRLCPVVSAFVLCAVLVAALPPVRGNDENSDRVHYTYLSRRGGEPAGEARELNRTAILYGPTEFSATPSDPARMTVSDLTVLGAASASDRAEVLCRSSGSSPAACTADLGEQVAGRRLTLVTRLWDEREQRFDIVRTSLVTLVTHPDRSVGLSGGVLEHTRADEYPRDQVRRLVLVQERRGKRSDADPIYRDDLSLEDFEVTVSGIDGARALSVEAPGEPREPAIPVFVNAAPYFRASKQGPEWMHEFPPLVRALTGGLTAAAARGVDAEYLVVQYAASGRTFGPFRLQVGGALTPEQQRGNDERLADLERWLLAPPPPEWLETVRDGWKSDFMSALTTLNDLYLRERHGPSAVALISDGTERRGPGVRFQPELWPEKLEELNRPWSAARLEQFYRRADRGLSPHHEALSRFIDELDPEDPTAAARISTFMAELDPGGTSSIQPHRTAFAPHVNALLIESPDIGASAGGQRNRASPSLEFNTFIERTYGGRIWRVFNTKKAGAEKFVDLLEATERELRHAYVVTLDVPNPRQDGAGHTLSLTLRETVSTDLELRYMSHHFSSRPLLEKMPAYLASPFKNLRMLSAHALRDYPFDANLYRQAADRRDLERDSQVRALLYESWISVELQRLQSGDAETSRRAYEKLSAIDSEACPDPALARRAGQVAEWYWRDHALASRARYN